MLSYILPKTFDLTWTFVSFGVSSEQRIGKVQTCDCGGEIHSICVIGNRGKHYHSEMRGFRRIDTFVGS